MVFFLWEFTNHDCCSTSLTCFIFLYSIKVLPFFDMFSPSICRCCETIAFHPKIFLAYCKEQNRNPQYVTVAAIRSFIKQHKIRCTSNCIRFQGTGIQVSSVHIPRAWFDKDVINKFDGREYYVNVLNIAFYSLYMQWYANCTSEYKS